MTYETAQLQVNELNISVCILTQSDFFSSFSQA